MALAMLDHTFPRHASVGGQMSNESFLFHLAIPFGSLMVGGALFQMGQYLTGIGIGVAGFVVVPAVYDWVKKDDQA